MTTAWILAGLFLSPIQQPWTDPSPHREGLVTAGKIRLHYLDWGGRGDRVVVFLTGMGVTPHIFDDLAPTFTPMARVLGLTRRGIGKSDKPESGYDTASLAEDIRRFLDALDVERATLVGWSLAGTEMTRFATLYPARAAGLVYLDAAYDYAGFPDLWAKDPLGAAPTPEDLSSFDASKRWFERTFGFWSAAVEADARAINLQPDGTMKMEAMSPEVTKSLMSGMVRARPDFTRVRAPILAFFAVSETHPLLHTTTDAKKRSDGDAYWKSRFLPEVRRQIAALRRTRPSARIVDLPGAPHLCFIRQQDVAIIEREMKRFLEGNTDRRRN